MQPVAELYSYMDFSEKFPLPATENGDAWARLLLRLRDEKKLKEGVHFKRVYVQGHFRRVYDVRTVVLHICREAKKDSPRPQCCYLAETYYDAFCAILTAPAAPPSSPAVPAMPDDKTP